MRFYNKTKGAVYREFSTSFQKSQRCVSEFSLDMSSSIDILQYPVGEGEGLETSHQVFSHVIKAYVITELLIKTLYHLMLVVSLYK